jgi:hypothetical protein
MPAQAYILHDPLPSHTKLLHLVCGSPDHYLAPFSTSRSSPRVAQGWIFTGHLPLSGPTALSAVTGVVVFEPLPQLFIAADVLHFAAVGALKDDGCRPNRHAC